MARKVKEELVPLEEVKPIARDVVVRAAIDPGNSLGLALLGQDGRIYALSIAEMMSPDYLTLLDVLVDALQAVDGALAFETSVFAAPLAMRAAGFFYHNARLWCEALDVPFIEATATQARKRVFGKAAHKRRVAAVGEARGVPWHDAWDAVVLLCAANGRPLPEKVEGERITAKQEARIDRIAGIVEALLAPAP